MEHQLIVLHFPGGLGIGIGILLHYLFHHRRGLLKGDGDGVTGAGDHGAQILGAPGEEVARLLGHSLLHGSFRRLGGNGGLLALDGPVVTLAGKGNGELRQALGKRILQQRERLLLGAAAYIDAADGGIGQEGAAAGHSTQDQIAGDQCRGCDEHYNQGQLAALRLFGLRGTFTRCLCHIDHSNFSIDCRGRRPGRESGGWGGEDAERMSHSVLPWIL